LLRHALFNQNGFDAADSAFSTLKSKTQLSIFEI